MKLTITRTLGTALVMTAIAAAGLAAPAYADPLLLNGTYMGADSEFAWTISSNCATAGCTANVASNQGWTSVATLTNGRWNFDITKPDGVICDDGRYAPAVISISIDAVTLDGLVSSDSNYGCPGGNISQSPFKLRKIG